MSISTITLARDAWKLLRGVCCIYKPSESDVQTSLKKFTENMTSDLNSMERNLDSGHSNGDQLVTYSSHPLVIGPGFEPEDMTVEPICINSYRMSGLTMININDEKSTRMWRGLTDTLPSTYRVTFRFGRTTDTLFTDGKTMELTTVKHLVGKPQRLLGLLQRVQRGHQKMMFQGTNLQTQEAYEMALRGAGRMGGEGAILGQFLVYNFSLVEYNVPDQVVCDVTAVNASEASLAELFEEVGFKLKTGVVTESIRRMRFCGFLTLQDCLQERHWSAQHVINNILAVKRKVDQHDPLKEHMSRRLNHSVYSRSHNSTEHRQKSNLVHNIPPK